VGCLFVFRQNSFASATIGITKGQTVITNGLYSIVRHPMYTAGLLIFLGAPLSLGSWWGLIVVPFLIGGLVTRLLDEEKYLSADLCGYGAYCERVRYRLVPLVY
jgi:protein-S-isoprenylcysteine O-methyltransferase Ste14